MSLVVLVLAGGCGGHDDRPDVAAPAPPATEAQVPTPVATTSEAAAASASPGSASTPTSRERGAIVTQAGVAEAAIRRWNGSVDSCVGSSGTGDDAGASCTRAAWDQLFDQMYAVQYELLDLMGRMARDRCREGLAAALDAVHGFLSGATPLKVVWLDDQQRPPSLFDLEAIVDVARPAPVRMREAVATTCRG